ncbi:protein C1orf43 homolog [Parasteatoda tepidariorum]|uniref:protein C1orf43 homolog n=1 Tax=Parasteatoda tepidariorum TaxID=114398 RepID=UPI00077F9F1C|nr:protein C1orf43 homolog [Parasteatoda tepidariorum]
MADPLSGIAIIICIAFGVLTFVLLFIFANRQIKRFSLKSRPGPHTLVAQDAPKSFHTEINRRLDVVKTISYQPKLLKKSDEIYFQDEIPYHRPVHIYRMKALDSISTLDAAILSADPSRIRPYNQDYRVFLVRLFQSGLFGQLEIATIQKYCDLFEIARHEPMEFNKEDFIQFTELMSQIQQSISTRTSNRQQNVSRTASSSHDSSRHFTNGKVPAVPSCLQVESTVEDKKATYETSV